MASPPFDVSKLVNYSPRGYPNIEGNEAQWFTTEFQNIRTAINSIETLLQAGGIFSGLSSTGQFLIDWTGFNPNVNANGAIVLSGAYGGGLVFSDGAYIGLWSQNFGTELHFGVGGTSGGIPTAMIIDSNGYVSIGDYTNPNIDGAVSILSNGVGLGGPWNFSGIGFGNGANSSGGIALGKTRGANSSTHVIVQPDDTLGSIWFYGSDGTGYREGGAIQVNSDGTPGLNSMPSRLTIGVTVPGSPWAHEMMRFDSNYNVQIFDSWNIPFSYSSPTANLSLWGERGNIWNAIFGTYGDNAFACDVAFQKTRGDPWDRTIVQDGDELGGIVAKGTDGSDFQHAADITFEVDGTPGAGSMPGRIILSTSPSGSTSSVERLRINQDGAIDVSRNMLRFRDPGDDAHSIVYSGGSPVDGLQYSGWQGHTWVTRDSGPSVEQFRIDSGGNVVCNNSSISTSATDGFFYITICAGAPTGTPTSFSGRVPMVYDSTNDKLWIYTPGSPWRAVQFV